jgi:hypothetical protein
LVEVVKIMRKMPDQCPVCEGREFHLIKTRCANCGTQIEGEFELPKLATLSQEHLDFVETFLRCRGNIKEVERELGISYPTVRRRLDNVIRALGYPTEEAGLQRRDILEALEQKKMTPEEAVEALKGLS